MRSNKACTPSRRPGTGWPGRLQLRIIASIGAHIISRLPVLLDHRYYSYYSQYGSMISACDQAARQASFLLLLLIERCHARWRPALVCLPTRLHGTHAHREWPQPCYCLALPPAPSLVATDRHVRMVVPSRAAASTTARVTFRQLPCAAAVAGSACSAQRHTNRGTAMPSHSAAEGTAGSISAGSAAKWNACTCQVQFNVARGMACAILHVASCMPRVVLHLSQFEPERLRCAVAHAPTHTVARSAIVRGPEYATHTCHDT